MTDDTTIRIKKTTRDRFKIFGKFGMSYDEVINDALDQLENTIDKHFEKSDKDYKIGSSEHEEEED